MGLNLHLSLKTQSTTIVCQSVLGIYGDEEIGGVLSLLCLIVHWNCGTITWFFLSPEYILGMDILSNRQNPDVGSLTCGMKVVMVVNK